MPELFWNAGTPKKKKGLDVLGLRGVDQDLERQWVAGITTISIRARYLSLIPWLLGEYFDRQLGNQDAAGVFVESHLDSVLRRFEAVVFLATHHLARNAGGGTPYGVLGRDLLQDEAAQLDAGDPIVIPDTKGGNSLATYFNPCRSFGLMKWGSSGSAPYVVPPRGRDIWQARGRLLTDSKLQSAIFEGGSVTPADMDSEGHLFSVNHLGAVPRELELLREAILGPNTDADSEAFQRFQQTVAWALGEIGQLDQVDSGLILQTNYAEVTKVGGVGVPSVEIAWCEYELSRRVHFACELLLGAFVSTLREQTNGTVPEIIDHWVSGGPLPLAVSDTFGWTTWPSLNMSQLSVPADCFLDSSPASPDAIKLGPQAAALYAMGVLMACIDQSQALRDTQRLQANESPLGEIIAFFAARADRTMRELMAEFLTSWLLPRHLHNALRKMAAGGDCTLRFFPEGNAIRATGLPVAAGQSGDRLRNVLGILADIGVTERVRNVSVRAADLGRQILNDRGASA